MKDKHPKPLATALNEVTVNIMTPDKNENYHETFMLDLKKNNFFEYDGQVYNMPKKDTSHYKPGFWQFGLKLAIFFEHHKTWAGLLDWFQFRKKASYMVNYLYWKGTSDPLTITSPSYDYAKENYHLRHNTSIEGSFRETDDKLKGPKNNMNIIMLIGAIVIIIVVAIVVFNMTNPAPVQQIQNITTTVHP